MARVALVSGGTRGIGAAISEALLKAGYHVAATYAGNNTAAEAFRAKTGVSVYRWGASDFEACAAGVRKVKSAVGPIDVLVNNGGHRLYPRTAARISTFGNHGDRHLPGLHSEMLDAVAPEVMAKSILPLIPVGRLGEPGSRAP
jgi:NAD(P)-dependent dehydrogenase (short-subunit alcohol dehydrogenase family)